MKQVPQEKEIIIPLLKILFIILSCKMELCYSSVVAILVIRIHRKWRNTKSTLSAFFAYLIHICRFSVFFFFPLPFSTSVVSHQSVLTQTSKGSMALMSKLHICRNFREKNKNELIFNFINVISLDFCSSSQIPILLLEALFYIDIVIQENKTNKAFL